MEGGLADGVGESARIVVISRVDYATLPFFTLAARSSPPPGVDYLGESVGVAPNGVGV